ncbi:hypothetical protein RI054_28g116310 [Pseudoscourfieldia marina]
MAPHYTDSEVMAIFMAGGAAATRDGRQSVERMERWTAKEYPVQVDELSRNDRRVEVKSSMLKWDKSKPRWAAEWKNWWSGGRYSRYS